MSPKHRLVYLLVLAASLACSTVVHSAATEQKRKYSKTVSFGVRRVHVDDACMTIYASLLAPDFFDNLERIQTPQGAEFRKKSDVVKTFPETIFVKIRAFVSKCGGGSTAEQEALSEVKLMESLSFEASWERDSETRTIGQVSIKRSPKTRSAFYHDWVYELSVPSRDVPLTDHLTVSIFTQDGKSIASFTAAL
jgi:hypothetical protein